MSAYPTPAFPAPAAQGRRARLLEACTELAPLFRRFAQAEHMPGVAYGVVLDGDLVHSHCLGVRAVDSQTPVATETVFRIASMTKSFVALAILQLRDAGRLRLDEPAATYVPELAHLAYPTGDNAPVTVRMLLTMTPGWPQDDPWADRQLYRDDAALSTIYRTGIPFSNPPGATFEYSNVAYMVLGRIISNVSGEPAMAYIDRAILRPLGMEATRWQAEETPPAQLAHGHRWEDDAWRAEPLLPCGGDVAAFAGLYTNVPDLARWVGLFLSAWPPGETEPGAPLCPSSLREMQQAWTLDEPDRVATRLGEPATLLAKGYGYGLSQIHDGRRLTVGHGGGLPGFGSHMRWAPAYGVGVVALANVTYANVHAACREALDLLLDRAEMPARAVPPAPALRQAQEGVNRLLAGWDDTVADELFADNFFLDLDRAHWQQRLEDLRARHGKLRTAEAIQPENWLRGRWRLEGDRGWCRVWLSLAPTTPPRIQQMKITSVLPPGPAMAKAAARLAALTAKPTLRALDRLRASTADRARLWEDVRLVHLLCGPCQVGDILAGDGEMWSRLRLEGAKRSVTVELRLNRRGKVVSAEFA